VRQDTIAVAGRFPAISGNPLPDLVSALTGESVNTASAVARLLGALGTLAAGEAAGLHDDIITALVAALTHERSRREVVLERGKEGTRTTTRPPAAITPRPRKPTPRCPAVWRGPHGAAGHVPVGHCAASLR
jgi:hypothetical protein